MDRLEYERLKRQAEQLEAMIAIYSGRDRLRMVELEKELFDVNMQILDTMTKVD